ncbi:hypothetical protein VCHA57P526_30217 [Vibrio chagasii]|nr:hypothetical protein VCHA57P526_30217 [Vibrio chagasii]
MLEHSICITLIYLKIFLPVSIFSSMFSAEINRNVNLMLTPIQLGLYLWK